MYDTAHTNHGNNTNMALASLSAVIADWILSYFESSSKMRHMDKRKPKTRINKFIKVAALLLLIGWVSINYELSNAFSKFDKVLNSE